MTPQNRTPRQSSMVEAEMPRDNQGETAHCLARTAP